MALLTHTLAILAFVMMLANASPALSVDRNELTATLIPVVPATTTFSVSYTTTYPSSATTTATPSPKPEPINPPHKDGTNRGPAPPPGLQENFYCRNSAPGTCTIGLMLAYDQAIMDIFIYDNNCALLGAGGGLTWDYPDSVSSRLPYPVIVTPHYDGAPSEFWYNGAHYQDGWEFQSINDDVFYDQMVFNC